MPMTVATVGTIESDARRGSSWYAQAQEGSDDMEGRRKSRSFSLSHSYLTGLG